MEDAKRNFLIQNGVDVEKGIENTVATCTLLAQLGYPVHFFEGAETNFKITTLDDVEIFKALLAAEKISWQR